MSESRDELRVNERVRLTPVELLAIVSFWALLAVLTAAGRLLDPRVPNVSPAISSALVTLSFIQFMMWALLTPPIVLLVNWVANSRRSSVTRMAILIVAGLVIAIVVDNVLRGFSIRLLPPPPGRQRPSATVLTHILRFEFLDDFMVYLAVLGAAFARDYYLRYRRHVDEARELQAQLTEARLAALRTQLNPHFLFNTLNAISALVGSDPAGVRKMVTRLSDLLRHTLDEAAEPEVPLSEEIELLQRYLGIMEVRFQGGLEVKLAIDPAVRDALVPNMILQPLVENAFKHGLSGMSTGARIDIRAALISDQVVLTIIDNGPGPQSDEMGVGLRNTTERLSQLYGVDHSFALKKDSRGGGAVAEIRLPYHTSPRDTRLIHG
jgi:two-component system, LytTR family, sensor kinase